MCEMLGVCAFNRLLDLSQYQLYLISFLVEFLFAFLSFPFYSHV